MDRMRRSPQTLLLFLLAPLLSGCGLICGDDVARDADYGGGELDVSSITYNIYQLLLTSGVPTEIGPAVETGIFEQKAYEMKIHGSPVFFLEYGSNEDADEIAETISGDGRTVAGKPIPMKGIMAGTPHFFKSSKVIAFYFGDRASTLAALTKVFDDQFAGGTSPAEGAESEADTSVAG
jgi:hypothetical protein